MLRADHVSLSYGAEPVLEGASLSIEAGQFVSLVGPSGSGKSSLLRAVMGLQAISAGRIDKDGLDAERHRHPVPGRCASALAHGGRERGARPAPQRPRPPRGAGRGGGMARPPQPVGFRGPLPARIERRTEEARRPRPGARPEAAPAAHGRAVRLARRHRARPRHPGRGRSRRARGHRRSPRHARPRRSDRPVRSGLSALAGTARPRLAMLHDPDPAAAQPHAGAHPSEIRTAPRAAVGRSVGSGRRADARSRRPHEPA